jgi:ribosomal-protein-alanine N-acetyltransferase
MLPERRKEGIGGRALALLCRWALSSSELGIARIQATVEPWNNASQRMLVRLGFQREGLLRSYASWRGGRQDVYLYSLLERELAAVAPPAAAADDAVDWRPC